MEIELPEGISGDPFPLVFEVKPEAPCEEITRENNTARFPPPGRWCTILTHPLMKELRVEGESAKVLHTLYGKEVLAGSVRAPT